jgi:hypothetical protein
MGSSRGSVGVGSFFDTPESDVEEESEANKRHKAIMSRI